MKTRFASLVLLATSALVSFAVTATASTLPLPDNVRHRFVILPNDAPGHLLTAGHAPSRLKMVQWNGSFVDKTGQNITFTMAGQDPTVATSGSTTVPAVVVPVILKYGRKYDNAIFDPTTRIVTGTSSTVIDMTLDSPIFQNMDFATGGVDLGTTQYIDAFQRANFWRTVKNNPNYHVLLSQPTVLAPLTIKVPRIQGDEVRHFTSDGTPVAIIGIDEFDAALQAYMTAHAAQINPSVIPIFITYQTYLIVNHNINNGVIGGYHSANGPQPAGQTYSYATFVDSRPHFSQDVEAVSHEVGEWMDDPFVDNVVNCNDNTGGALEVGDPLEGDTNYGGYPYALGGYTYNLQSLVFMEYWGDVKKGTKQKPPSVNQWFTFQGPPAGPLSPASHDSITGVCPGPQNP
jgi:hypothetical protein